MEKFQTDGKINQSFGFLSKMPKNIVVTTEKDYPKYGNGKLLPKVEMEENIHGEMAGLIIMYQI